MTTRLHYAKSRAPARAAPAVEANFALTFSTVGSRALVMRHPAKIKDRSLQIGAGTPVMMADVLQSMLDLAGGLPLTWCDDRVIASGAMSVVWMLPAAVRPMWFVVGKKTVRLTVPWPHLVLEMRRGGALRVFAMKGEGRPAPDAPAFHAPLMNIGEKGSMCFGSVASPEFGNSHRAQWEMALTCSRFSHVNHPRTLSGDEDVTDADHLAFWKGLNGKSKFPEDALVPYGLPLQEALERA